VSTPHAEAYRDAVTAAEADYSAAYEAAKAEHDAQLEAARAALEAAVEPARAVRDAALALALAEYEQAEGITRDEAPVEAPVTEVVDGDVAAGQEQAP